MHSCYALEAGHEVQDEQSDVSGIPTDTEEDEEQDIANATAVDLAITIGDESMPPLPAEGLLRHARLRTIHRRAGGGTLGVTACGLTLLPADAEELDAWPGMAWPRCGRAKCFKE